MFVAFHRVGSATVLFCLAACGAESTELPELEQAVEHHAQALEASSIRALPKTAASIPIDLPDGDGGRLMQWDDLDGYGQIDQSYWPSLGYTFWPVATQQLMDPIVYRTDPSHLPPWGMRPKDVTQALVGTYAFDTLPSNAVIVGVRAGIYWIDPAQHPGSKTEHLRTQLMYDGTLIGQNIANRELVLIAQVRDFGGRDNTWGTGDQLTAWMFRTGKVATALTFRQGPLPEGQYNTLDIDTTELEVFYVPGATVSISQEDNTWIPSDETITLAAGVPSTMTVAGAVPQPSFNATCYVGFEGPHTPLSLPGTLDEVCFDLAAPHVSLFTQSMGGLPVPITGQLFAIPADAPTLTVQCLEYGINAAGILEVDNLGCFDLQAL